ncbi:TPA: transposase [Bacillus cereus]|uniref:helix-turn-helix domain-containing protein n=1 Tax=Bacillus cereus group sp. FL70 TaxID=3040254 RepID=UPI00330318EA|nr:transposase [Bacillus cereus]
MTQKGTTFNTYSNEINLSAVQSYLNGEGSCDMIAEKYQIRSSTQFKHWIKKYKERYHIIELLKRKYPVIWLTNFANVHCSSYYKWVIQKV